MALSTPTESDPSLSPSERPVTRRERRAAQIKRSTDIATARPIASRPATRSASSASGRPSARTAPSSAAPAAQPSRWKRWRSTLVMMIVVPGLCAAFALPGTFAPASQAAPLFEHQDRTANAQELSVSTEASIASVSRDTYSATSQSELDAAAAEKAAAEAAKRAEEQAANRQSSSDSSGTDTSPVAPPTTPYSLSAVFNTAKQYIGTPYVYGGATPAGFDCSGFVMYVFGQYGISLPHGVSGQAAAGTRISVSQAQPGDLVIMSGHDGFYAGNGMILDAPKPGGHVSIRPIWTSSYYIVRI
ncbi:C40 family peptidase [Paramicrobacterium chengjingii]|uniref:C40 family peptidase n=1 Tax=Paramicrobacterium chengjingii TaxID=2769067 RepID=A0ABX6YG30_9MICO|nr:C40 family peptidase [Microbacterium chengjingii]QPZ37352.1 C40 family peptidase [Microbacterium chengjingii]